MAKTSEAQLKAIKEYRKNTKKIQIEFSPTEMDMWDHLQAQDKKQTYIKNLIRADMNKEEA